MHCDLCAMLVESLGPGVRCSLHRPDDVLLVTQNPLPTEEQPEHRNQCPQCENLRRTYIPSQMRESVLCETCAGLPNHCCTGINGSHTSRCNAIAQHASNTCWCCGVSFPVSYACLWGDRGSRCFDCEGHDPACRAHVGMTHRQVRDAEEQPERSPWQIANEVLNYNRNRLTQGGLMIAPDGFRFSREADEAVQQYTATMLGGIPAPDARAIAEAKIEAVLNWPDRERALLFTMLRAQGMDSDRARMLLRDAKWNLP